MFDHLIEVCGQEYGYDEYNERTKQLRPYARVYAQVTEHGGRENLYASRIVHENEVVYTVRYRNGLGAGMVVKDGFRLRKIVSMQVEGRKRLMHLVTVATDAGECYDDT